MEKETPNIEGRIEALLFLFGSPVRIKKLADTLGVKIKTIEEGLESLKEKLKSLDRGLTIIEHEGKVQLATKPELNSILAKTIADDLDTPLTPASLETIAIVAYLGPCRRSLIEHIRGVNSSFILRSLLIRGIVEREPDPQRHNTFLYKVTFDFLRHMGVESRETLPDYDKYKNFADLFTASPQALPTEQADGGEENTSQIGEESVGEAKASESGSLDADSQENNETDN